MSPLADAMSFIHGDARNVGPAQHRQGAHGRQSFRRHIEQAQITRVQGRQDRVVFIFGIGRGQGAGANTRLFQRAHLIAHQGNQGRHDQCDPIPHQRRQLITQGFPATRGHDGQRVFTVDHGLHDIRLSGAKVVESEYRGQKPLCLFH